MTEFEERLANHLEKLRSNATMVSLIKKYVKDEVEQRKIFYPKDEKELADAEAIVTFMDDYVDLMFRNATGNVKEIAIEDNYGIKYMASCIKAGRYNLEPPNLNSFTPEELAQIVYGTTVAFLTPDSTDKSIEYLARICDFNIHDSKEAELFLYYLEKAHNALPSTNNLEINNIEEDELMSNFIKEFHKICENGKIEEKEDPIVGLVKLLLEL